MPQASERGAQGEARGGTLDKILMRVFDPWIGASYATQGLAGKQVLILGESHYGGSGCEYSAFTTEVIRDMALEKGRLAFFSRVQRLLIGGRGGFSETERSDFWQRVAFYNFIQSALECPRDRPTYAMWQAGREPLLQTLRELAPRVVIVLGLELDRNLPALPPSISSCAVQHPSSIGFRYDDWQPKIQTSLTTL